VLLRESDGQRIDNRTGDAQVESEEDPLTWLEWTQTSTDGRAELRRLIRWAWLVAGVAAVCVWMGRG
jgi:hypothetical protein